ISSLVPQSKKAVLYIHGFNDYFFNKEFAAKFVDEGYSFFAIDLHNHGKNMTKDTKRYYFTDVKEFYPEINLAIDIMKNKYKIENITLYGISQGGLIAALYENDNQRVDQLILDSPFFDFHMAWFIESIAIPIISTVGSFFPELKIQSDEPNLFGQSIHKDFSGEWDIDLELKAITKNAPVYLGWLNAVNKAQNRLEKGLDIKVPSLVLSSDISTSEQANPKYHHSTDTVLDIEEIQTLAKKLSVDQGLITAIKIPKAMHGVLISPLKVREKGYETIFNWLKN
ncbi:MAG: alpha/beta hydrolase, partial [Campylobacteraceae bacterium]|nr:alpha/beta hydrolase [Campylobacteraceae bacterium]